MTAGEKEAACQCRLSDRLSSGTRRSSEKAGVADKFPHHAGHGLGLAHPENPYFVRGANETLLAGDVVTLEPGRCTSKTWAACCIENNYLVTEKGFVRSG